LQTGFPAPDGATENEREPVLAPHPGLNLPVGFTHGCTVGYFLPLLRSLK
jgi:hypothetical protein